PTARELRRRGPQGFFTDAELLERIRAVLAESPFTGEGYRKVWAMLRDKGVRTSKERTLRLMRENGLLAVKRPGRPHGPKAHNWTIRTGRVDEMWGTGMTTTITLSEGNASIFFAIDRCSLELVGIHAASRGTRFEALEPIRQGVRHSFGSFGKEVASGLTLRHDHGSQFISEDFQREIAFLGIKDSPSYVREPQGNGIAERFVRILKENLLWVRRFQAFEDLRLGLLAFKDTYNRQWRIGRHGYRSPAQVRERQKLEVAKAA
ncbi:IS3 family transposase, partial [Fundidesulfovibrio agrisoli]|uniref:IS3 family transposase n=1 Tax=Fundidesulfovibrio agrisoli TaxID=2922717 RepID=UPI001FABFBB6